MDEVCDGYGLQRSPGFHRESTLLIVPGFHLFQGFNVVPAFTGRAPAPA